MAEKSIPLLSGILEYTHSGSALTGTGKNGKFKATSSGAKSSFTVNGVSYSVRCGEDTEIELVNGLWYTFILDTAAKTINFNMGGAGASSVPDGTSATPVNDVKIWQRCAGLNAKYTDVSQIIQDTQWLKSILMNNNAVEYMIRSTDIQSAVLASSQAVSLLDDSLYWENPFMNSDTSPQGECFASRSYSGYYDGKPYQGFQGNDRYWTPAASYAAQTGDWLMYSFASPRWIYKVSVYCFDGNTHSAKIQGQTESGAWVDLTDSFSNVSSQTNTPSVKAFAGRVKAVRYYVMGNKAMVSNFRVRGK